MTLVNDTGFDRIFPVSEPLNRVASAAVHTILLL